MILNKTTEYALTVLGFMATGMRICILQNTFTSN